MKPHTRLAEAIAPDGDRIYLYEHDGAFTIRVNNMVLMDSMAGDSELRLGELGMEHCLAACPANRPARIFIGGLGLGFTLAKVLELARDHDVVELLELMPEVIEWNRSFLRELNGKHLDDPRVELLQKDAAKQIRSAAAGTYDLILLDVDNGPAALVAKGNASLYSNAGLNAIQNALSAKGRVIFWSAESDARFEGRLRKMGFQAKTVSAKVHKKSKREAYALIIADQT